jgi:murein tripeptide amidase MpaA
MAGSYYNVVEIESALQNLANNYASLCTRIPLPNPTAEGRSSNALKISSGSGHPKGTVLLLGGTHGREWGSSEILLAFAADLLRAFVAKGSLTYGGKTFSTNEVQALLHAIDIVVFPLVNPDGMNFSHANDGTTVGGWRKNRNASALGTGVDLNRNFDFVWDFRQTMTGDVWTSDDPNDAFYFGTAPFSERETRNVKFLFEALPDIRWLVDIHSASESILFNWGTGTNDSSDPSKNFRNPAWDQLRGDSDTGYTEFIPPNDFTAALTLSNAMKTAILAVRGKDYSVKQSFDLYAVSGTSEDYAYSRFWVACAPKVQGFVIEFGEVFRPPWNEMQLIIGDISAALFAFCGAARERVRASSGC